jgi:ATP adenylyltransferase
MSEQLWAPWRLKYIEKAQTQSAEDCFFDALPQETNDRENFILYRGKSVFVILNAFPYNNGHLMVAPYRHVADLEEMSEEELLEVNQTLSRCVSWLKKAYSPEGFNIGVNLGKVAGAGVPGHIHWHIVPRWNGDSNFMTVIGEVRVLPENLYQTYDRLKSAME